MRIVAFLLIFFLVCSPCLYASEWKKIYEEADTYTIEDAIRNVQLSSASKKSSIILGLVYFNTHKDEEAFEVFSKILKQQPDCVEAKWGVAEAYRRRHQISISKRMVKEIIDSNKDFYPAFISLAYIEYTMANFENSLRLAMSVYRKPLSSVDKSNYVRALLLIAGNKGFLAHYGGPVAKITHGTKVYSFLKKAEKLQPDSAMVKFGLGSFYLLSPSLLGGDSERAKEYFDQALMYDGLFADAYARLAQIFRKRGDKLKYTEYLDKALQIDPLNELAIDIKTEKCRFICE